MDVKKSSPGLVLTDRKQLVRVPVQDLGVDVGKQQVTYDKLLDRVEAVLYWNLPFHFTGNKVN